MNQKTDNPILVVRNLSKSYGSLMANDRVSFEVYKGEIHCLLGENGAGKTTAAKCIYGAAKYDSGRIIFKNQEVAFSTPRDAIKMNIGMVHQHFVLAEPMNAVENIIVGEDSVGIFLNLNQEINKIQSLCHQYGVDLDLRSPISRLSVGEQQWVEILKSLYVGVDLLILDEPTAVLTPQEVERLFAVLEKMSNEGITIILITHKLHEVMDISDRVTVLRKGETVTTVDTAGCTKKDLAKLLVGKDFDFHVEKVEIERGAPALEIKDLSVLGDNRNLAIDSVSLTVHEGEILGLAGVSGNGQKELFDTLVGVRQPQKGEIYLRGEEITDLSPAEVSRKGIASIPQDRLKQGLIDEFSVQENIVLGFHRNQPFSHLGILDWQAIREFSKKAIEEFEIMTKKPGQKVKELSGGNLQRTVLAREISNPVKVVIASSPTRGLDINATYYVYRRFLELLKLGSGILLISEDLDEIFNVSDRIAVIYNGRIMEELKTTETNKQEIGLLMAGIK